MLVEAARETFERAAADAAACDWVAVGAGIEDETVRRVTVRVGVDEVAGRCAATAVAAGRWTGRVVTRLVIVGVDALGWRLACCVRAREATEVVAGRVVVLLASCVRVVGCTWRRTGARCADGDTGVGSI
ncbi:hypothetical protein D1224_13815 [Henriciella barbarensis]|uniref:Uncharacterized protein n=1 Tax=Henriciella barbarensis TaxID=86342 RepID=A0A399QR30_9PROT|nr:hypothetical protein [Henriciella barbarensis]RIJ21386.1 hypothetical protein D1224_13815 [Henriciella barbarensis]